MKALSRLFPVILLQVVNASAPAQTLRPTQLDEETAQLVARGGDELMTSAQAQQWRVEMRLRPGITDKLWNYLWAVMDGKEEDEVEHLLLALAQRDDLSKQRELELINRLEGYANNQLPKRGTREFELALGLIFVLERGTDPRAESLAIKLMNSTNPDAVFCVAGALRVMKKMGGPASLETIAAYVKRRFGSPPENVGGYQDFADTITVIRKRMASSPGGGGAVSRLMPSTALHAKSHVPPTPGAKPDDRPPGSTSWAIIAIMTAAALGLLWLTLKRRGR